MLDLLRNKATWDNTLFIFIRIFPFHCLAVANLKKKKNLMFKICSSHSIYRPPPNLRVTRIFPSFIPLSFKFSVKKNLKSHVVAMYPHKELQFSKILMYFERKLTEKVIFQ